MPRVKSASLFRQKGIWYVSWWCGGKRVKESTGTDNRKVAEDVRRQREKEMILGETDLQHEVSLALNDPRRRDAVLKALETVEAVEAAKARDEYLAHCETFKRPKTVAGDRGRLTKSDVKRRRHCRAMRRDMKGLFNCFRRRAVFRKAFVGLSINGFKCTTGMNAIKG